MGERSTGWGWEVAHEWRWEEPPCRAFRQHRKQLHTGNNVKMLGNTRWAKEEGGACVMDVQHKYFLARQFRSNHAKLTPGKQSVPIVTQTFRWCTSSQKVYLVNVSTSERKAVMGYFMTLAVYPNLEQEVRYLQISDILQLWLYFKNIIFQNYAVSKVYLHLFNFLLNTHSIFIEQCEKSLYHYL